MFQEISEETEIGLNAIAVNMCEKGKNLKTFAGGDPFCRKAAESLLTGCLVYVYEMEKDNTGNALAKSAELISKAVPEERTQILSESPLMQKINMLPADAKCRQYFDAYLLCAPKTGIRIASALEKDLTTALNEK